MGRGPAPADSIAARSWRGLNREYDLLKELTVGLVVTGLAVILLAALLGSPDEAPVSLRDWARAAPNDLTAAATAELAGTSDTATYGPPYTAVAGAGQSLGPINLQQFAGVRIPVDPASVFVIRPLTLLRAAPAAVAAWNRTPNRVRTAEASAYADALAKTPGGRPDAVEAGNFGPVPALAAAVVRAAGSGGMDRAVGSAATDPTDSVLFLGDGTYFTSLAARQHLTGDQWGVMNETGSYPGQSWLWLFSFWYQIPALGGLDNADLVIVGIMLVLTVLLALVPVLPGLRSIPRWIPVHRLIWRDYYRHR